MLYINLKKMIFLKLFSLSYKNGWSGMTISFEFDKVGYSSICKYMCYVINWAQFIESPGLVI